MIFVPHRRPGPMLPGRLVARPNRFLTVVELDDGRTVEAHLGDRGRLADIVYPGAEVWVVRAEGPLRKTSFTLMLARGPALEEDGHRPLVALDPAGANRLVLALMEARKLRVGPHERIVPEVKDGDSRFDFAVERGGRGPKKRMFVEVKSCAVARGRSALFPDAPSLRAARHARELAAKARRGEDAMIVMVALRSDVDAIRPHPVDPDFRAALREARDAGVRLSGQSFEVGLEGFTWCGPRRVVA